MALGVNKGAAISSILEQHDIPLSAAIAFGDGMNDYEMLSMVGHGVVMGNAHDRLEMALPIYRGLASMTKMAWRNICSSCC